jgi:hypothetical protein
MSTGKRYGVNDKAEGKRLPLSSEEWCVVLGVVVLVVLGGDVSMS